MHDLVCDVARSARKTRVIRRHKTDPEAFFVRISLEVTGLCCYNICEFVDQVNLPKLEILFVSNSCSRSPEFTDEFFEGMRELKVLAIINTFAWGDLNLLLPLSIDLLKNLRTLCLNGWILGGISILGELKMLETIELWSCVIEQLPNGLAKLRKLKSLEVSRCSMGRNPLEVLAECSQLEDLYFVGNHLYDGMGSDAYYALHLIDQIVSSEVLQRYRLEIGTSRFTLENDLISKFLSLNDFHFDLFTSRTLHDNTLARKLEVFYLNNMKGMLSSIVPDMIPAEGKCVNELIELSLCNSDSIECLIDIMNNQLSHDKIVFSKLLKLRLFDMGGLEVLCLGLPPSGLFVRLEELLITSCKLLCSIVPRGMLNLCNLKHLQLRDCGSLECLFTYSTAQTMTSLKVLKVKDCRLLKYIVTFEGEDDIFSITVMFPKLREVSIVGCGMRCIGPASFADGLSELEILKIKDAPQLEYVFGECNDGIVQSLKIDLSALKVFKLTNLPKITSIAPENCNIACPSLAGLHVRGCPNLISTSGLDLKESQQSDDGAIKQDSGPPTQLSSPMIELATNMESNSEPDGLPQHYKGSDKQEARVTMEEERCHDDYAVDKDEKEAGQDKGEKYGIPEDNNGVIEQGDISRVDRRELDKGSLEIEKGSFHNNPALEESKEGTSTTELNEKQPNVEPQLPLVLENQQQALEEYKDSHEVQVVAEVHPQSQKLDVIDDTQEGFQVHNPNPVDSVNLKESSTKIGKGSLHKDAGLEEPKVETSTQELIDKQPQGELDANVAKVQDATEVLPQSKVFDVISDTQSNMEIEKVLTDKQTQVVIDPQQALQYYKVLSPSPSITTPSPTSEALFSSSIKQQEDFTDFQGLSRHAHLPDGPHQQKRPEYDSRNEVQEAANIHVQSHTGLTHSNEDRDKENQRGNNDIPRGSIAAGSTFHLLKQDAAEVHPQEGIQKQKLCTVDSMNLQESNMEIAKPRLHKDPASEKSTVGTSSQVMIDKQEQVVTDQQQALQDYKAPRQQKLPEDDSRSEVKGAANIHVQSQNIDIISETHEIFQKHHSYPVSSINLTQSNKEITKGNLHSPKESTTRTSSQKLIEKQPQVELVLPQVETYQQAFSQNNVLPLPQPVHPTLEAPTSSSMKQHSIAEELADFHGIARRACLLEEAFVKYPHLRNWKISQKSSRFCKGGYESLSDMLELLKSEKPKTMDDSKRTKFEDLCLELESFGFDKEWLASIRQRVMAKQVDHSDKLKQLVQVKSDVSSLEDQLNDGRARMNSIEHDLSKLDDVFGL